MSNDRRYQHEYLKRALLGSDVVNDQDMVRRYQTNAEFHASIDTLAAVLPIFVDALAKHCDEQESKARVMMEMIRNEPPLPFSLPKFNLPNEKSETGE